MHKIDRAFFPTEDHEHAFQRLCNNFIAEKRIHKEHMRMVKKTEGLPDDDERKYQPYPEPDAHPDVMSAVVEDGKDYNIQYELFDGRTLEEKKQELISSAIKTAEGLKEKIYPFRKLPLLMSKINNEKASKAEIELGKSIVDKFNLVDHHFAQLQSDIHDLTEKNIDQWKPEDFPEVTQ